MSLEQREATRDLARDVLGARTAVHHAHGHSRVQGHRPDLSRRIRGRLRVSMPVLFGQFGMGEIAARFLKAHPGVELEVSIDDRFVDPVDQVERLADLWRRGLISRQEFEREKSKVFDG